MAVLADPGLAPFRRRGRRGRRGGRVPGAVAGAHGPPQELVLLRSRHDLGVVPGALPRLRRRGRRVVTPCCPTPRNAGPRLPAGVVVRRTWAGSRLWGRVFAVALPLWSPRAASRPRRRRGRACVRPGHHPGAVLVGVPTGAMTPTRSTTTRPGCAGHPRDYGAPGTSPLPPRASRTWAMLTTWGSSPSICRSWVDDGPTSSSPSSWTLVSVAAAGGCPIATSATAFLLFPGIFVTRQPSGGACSFGLFTPPAGHGRAVRRRPAGASPPPGGRRAVSLTIYVIIPLGIWTVPRWSGARAASAIYPRRATLAGRP